MPPRQWQFGAKCGHGPSGRSHCCIPVHICPDGLVSKLICKCGNEQCGKGLCEHRGDKRHCRREPCVAFAKGICKPHGRHQGDCDECRRTPRPRCPKHGSLKRAGRQCRGCLKEAKAAAKEKTCKPCEAELPTAPPPEVRVSKGRKIFPGGPWPMGPMRASPELG